eukprot:gene8897-9848_t
MTRCIFSAFPLNIDDKPRSEKMNEDVNLNDSPVLHILVVGFHHQLGSEVQFVYPEFPFKNAEKSLPIPWKPLLHLALPDGAHNFEDDYVFFKLPCIEASHMTRSGNVFGVACFQQIASKDLKVKEDDVTRAFVQKSVVIISKMPLFGFIVSKLSLVTQAYFSEKDFSQTTILKDTFKGLNQSLLSTKPSNAVIHIGLSLKELVMKFQEKILILFKLLMLEHKVVMWGSSAGLVSKSILSLLSLFPDLLKTDIEETFEADKEGNHTPKDEYGLPMDLFDEEYVFHPYLSLQQMHALKSETVKGYLIGASNILYRHQNQVQWDCFVDLETSEITITDSSLFEAVSLTTEDLRFTNFILSTVDEFDDESGIAWDGSDDWIRIQFKYYILCLLSSVAPEKGNFSHINRQFNEKFISRWKTAKNFKTWCRTRHPGLEDIHLGHPFEGSLTISDIRLRMRSRLGSVTLSDESREKIGAAVQKTGQAVGMALSSAKTALTSWKGWLTGIVQEINDEMSANSKNIEFVNSNEQEVSPSSPSKELSHGMSISEDERTGKR